MALAYMQLFSAWKKPTFSAVFGSQVKAVPRLVSSSDSEDLLPLGMDLSHRLLHVRHLKVNRQLRGTSDRY